MSIFKAPPYADSADYQSKFAKRSRSITSLTWIWLAVVLALINIINPSALSIGLMVGIFMATLTFYIAGSSFYRNDQKVDTPYRVYEIVPGQLIGMALGMLLLGIGLTHISINTITSDKIPADISKESLSEIYIENYIQTLYERHPDQRPTLAHLEANEKGLKTAIEITSKEAFDPLFDDLWQHYSGRERNRDSYIVSLYRDSVRLNEISIRKDISDAYIQVRVIANAHNFGGPFRTNVRRNERGAAEFYTAVNNLLANVFDAPPMPDHWEVNNKRLFEQHLNHHHQLPEQLTGTFIYHLERFTDEKDRKLRKLYATKKEDFEGRVAPIRRDFSDEQIISHPVITFLRYHRYLDERFLPLMIPPKGSLNIVPMGLSQDEFRAATLSNYVAHQFDHHWNNAQNRYIVNNIAQQNWLSESTSLILILVAILLIAVFFTPIYFYQKHSLTLHTDKK